MIFYLLAINIAILIMSKPIKKSKGILSQFFKPSGSSSNSENYSSFEGGARPENTKQLAYWLRQNTLSPEQTELLQELALSVIDEFAKTQVKSPAKIREVVALASIPVQR